MELYSLKETVFDLCSDWIYVIYAFLFCYRLSSLPESITFYVRLQPGFFVFGSYLWFYWPVRGHDHRFAYASLVTPESVSLQHSLGIKFIS